MEVTLDLDPKYDITVSPDHPVTLKFSYEKKQCTTNQRVKYEVKNLTNTELKIWRGTKIGEAHFMNSKREQEKVKVEPIKEPFKKEFEKVDCNQDNLSIKYPHYEKFIRTLMNKDKQITPTKVEDVLKFCVLFIGDLEDLIKKNYDPSRSVADYAGIIKIKSIPASFVTELDLEMAIQTYVSIIEDKKIEDDRETDQEDSSSAKPGTIKLVPLSKLKTDNSSEYIEFMDPILEPKVKMLHADDIKDRKMITVAVNKEKVENKNQTQLPLNSLDLLPEPCPIQAPETSEEEDVLMINLPSPCPSVSRAGVVAGADVRVSSEAEEQILKSPIGGQPISDQAAEKKSSDTICTENDDSKSGEPNKGKRARKRITMSDQLDQRSESPELPQRVVIMKEPEDPENICCPHFEVSDKRQRTCHYCICIKKGKARCQNISHAKHCLSQEQGVCIFELINQDGCEKLDCARAHFAPNDLHIEPLPFCLDYLRNFCSAKCKRPHLHWKRVDKILVKIVHSLFESCDVCLTNFTEDRDELLRQKNKSFGNKSRRRPPPNRRRTVDEETVEEDDEVEGEKGSSLKRPICKHFLEGTCIYGSSCWNYHDVSRIDLRKKIPRY